MSVGPSHETPCNSAAGGRLGSRNRGEKKTYNEKICQKEVMGLSVDFSGCVPLFAGAAAAGKPVPNPDGARTIPGWLTLTGPSRLMMSVSLVLLA